MQLSSSRLAFYFRGVGFSPLPEKLATGGEDAYISTSNVQAVLDGVSWWRDNLSVDAGLYSAGLAKHMYEYVEEDMLGDLPASSFRLLNRGYELSKHGKVLGTATALVATLQSENKRVQERDGYQLIDFSKYVMEEEAEAVDEEAEEGPCVKVPDAPIVTIPSTSASNHYLDVAYVGDCSLLLIRGGKPIFKTEEQQHNLDYPFQLGDGSLDTPKNGVRQLIPVQRGDVVVMGSDGIFDNVYAKDISRMIWNAICDAPLFHHYRYDGDVLDATLTALNRGVDEVVAVARGMSLDIHGNTPYASRCIENGAYYEGGKPDDMTLLASIIEDETFTTDLERLSAGLFPPPYRDWP